MIEPRAEQYAIRFLIAPRPILARDASNDRRQIREADPMFERPVSAHGFRSAYSADPQGLQRVEGGRTLSDLGSSHKGGLCAFEGRLPPIAEFRASQ